MNASQYVLRKTAGTVSLVVVDGNVFANAATFDPLTGKQNSVQNLTLCDPADAAAQLAAAQQALSECQQYQADITAALAGSHT